MIGRREQALNYAILVFFSAIALYPIVGIVLTALAPPGELVGFGLPSSLHFANFRDAWDEGHFATYLRSSVIVAVAVVATSTLLSILAGYAIGTMRFPISGSFIQSLSSRTVAMVVATLFLPDPCLSSP